MQRFGVNLKTFLGLVMPNQCCNVDTKLILHWFIGEIFGQGTPYRLLPYYMILFYSINALQCPALKVYSNMCCSPNLNYVHGTELTLIKHWESSFVYNLRFTVVCSKASLVFLDMSTSNHYVDKNSDRPRIYSLCCLNSS